MSTLSGLATKGEKGKSKFQSLDINSLYRGESLEPAQKTILRKHGMQSLGRVPTARRAPINLPSLKAETSGADPPVSLVPSGGTGWGSKPSGEGGSATASPAVNQGSAAVAALLPPAAVTLQPPNTTQPPSQASLPQSRQPPISGPVGTTVAPEFPKLSGGSEVDSSLTNTTPGGSSVGGVSQLSNAKGGSTSGVDVQYGPGPSLRPQSMVGDGLGARGAALGAGGPSTPLGQTQVVAGGGGGVPQTGTSPVGPSGGVGAAAGGGGSNAATTPFSGIMPRFMYRGGFPAPGGFPPNFQPPIHGGTQRPQRFGYPSCASGPGATEGEGGPTNRFGPGAGGRPPGPPNVGQGGPQTAEEEVFQRPIIKEEDLNKMDDIVRGNGWATQDDIDYNQKLSFSDDESTEDDSAAGQPSRKDAAASTASSSSSQAPQQGSGSRGVNQSISQHHPIPLLPQSQNPPLHLHLKGKEGEGRRNTIGRSPEDERDGLVDLDHRDDVRGRMDERNRDAKRLDGNRLVDGRVGWGQPGSRPGAPPPLMPPSLMDYRGGSRSSSGINVPSSQQGPAVPPASLGNIMQGPFKMTSHMPFGAATGRLLDDDEVWLEKRRQTTEEVAIAVVRAKQRKEEEEKKFEESKQAAAKKLQNLEEKMGVNKGKKDAQSQQQHVEEGSPEWERDRSRLSSEGREDKGPASNAPVARETIREIPRDSPGEREFRPAPPLMGGSGGSLSRDRDRDRELRGERERDRHDYKFSRAFQSNLPPRFQRQQQQAEQQHLPSLRGPSSPPPRPRPTSGPTPPGGAQPSPSPPSVTSSEPSTPAEGRGSLLTHESRWGSLGSSQPPTHYPAQGISGMKSGSSSGRRGIRDEALTGSEREREPERDREDRNTDRGRGSSSSSETSRPSANSNPLDIREKERSSEPKRVISTSEDRDRRMDDRYRHERNVRGSGIQGGYMENGRRAYYDGPDYGRGYNRGPPQDYDFDRPRSDRDHSVDADQPRFNDLRHGALSQSRDFDPWDRDREKDGRMMEKEGRDKERGVERERMSERGPERERDRDRMDRERDRVPERGVIADRDRVINDRDGRRVVSERDDRMERDRIVERERLLERGMERLERERGSRGVVDRPCDRDRNGDRVPERGGERERGSDRERLSERPSERERGSERDRITERDRQLERDSTRERDRPVDRERPNERERAAERERIDRVGERSDRQVERGFDGDIRGAERERSTLERTHERGQNERERGMQGRMGNRDRLRDRGIVERDGERDGERSIERESERRGGERGQRDGEYRDMRRFDDRRGGDSLESKKGASGENYPERRGPPQQQDSFEPEVDNRQVALEWRESKEWKEDRRTGSLSDERRQGTEDRPQRPDSRDDRIERDSRRETSHDSKNSQLPDVPGDINGKGPSSNGGRRGDFVSSSSWADAPVEPLYTDVQEEKKEEYFRNEHRPLIENSSNVERESEGAWGFPRGGPPSACAQGHVPRGPGAEQSGVVGVAAGAPTTRGPPNRLSPSPPPPTTPSPSGEGPQSPGRPPRAVPLPLGGSSTAPPPPLQTRQPQRQLSSTTTPITPAVETTWADEPVVSTDSMLPQEERLAREMLPSAAEGGTMMDGKGPVNDKVKVDALEEKEPELVKEEEKKEEEPLPKRERGGRGRSNQRPRQQGSSSSRSGSQWAGARGGNSQSRGQRAPGVKWTEDEEEEAEINAGEGDSEFSAEEEGSGESGKEGRGVRSSSQAAPEGEGETVGERHTASQDSKRLQGREGFAPRGEPSRRGRGGGAGFRTRGNMGRRIDRYGPPPSGCPFGQPREEGPAAEIVEELGEEKDKGKSSRHPPGSATSGKDGSSNRVGKSAQGSSSIPPRMQRRGDSDRPKKSRGGRGGGESGAQRNNEGGRKHVTGPESRQGSSDVAEWETTSENSDAEDSVRERREGKKGSKGQRGWSGSSDSATAGGSSSGTAVGGSTTSRAPGAEKKSNSGGQRMSPAPVARTKGKGKEESGNVEGSRRAASGAQNRPSHTPLIGGNLDLNAEKVVEGIDVGTYSSVAPADDLRLVAEDQGDPHFPFDADTSGFREVRGRRGGGRVGPEESSMPVRQQQSSQRQQRREGSRGEGRGGKGGGKGQAPVGMGRSSGAAPRTGTPSPGPSNSSSATSVPLRPGSPSSVAGGSFERNRPKLPPRLIKQKETERLQKQQAQQQQGRGGHMGGSFNNTAYHSHHGTSSSHMRNDVGDTNHHHQGKMVVSGGVLFPMKDSNGGAISSGVNAWEKPLGASSAIGSSSPASSSSGVGITLGGPGSSVGEERGGDSAGERSAVMSGSGSGHRDSPTGSEQGLGNGVSKVPSVQKLAIEKPSSVLLDGTSPPVQTIIFENTNYKSGPPSASTAPVPKYNSHHHHHHHHSHKMQRVLEKGRGNDRKMTDDSDDGVTIGYGGSKDLTKVGGIDVKADPMQLPLGFAKNAEDNSEMKLDFAFHSELSQLTEEKGHGGVKSGNNSGGGTIVGSMALQRNMHVGSTIGTAAELNYKIAAVKTFWENAPTMPTVLEISESNDGGSGVAVASSSVAAVTSASPSSSSPSLAPGVATVTTGFVVEQPSSSVVVVTGEDGSALSATEVVFSPGTPMQGSNSFGVAPASLGKGDPNSTTSNVCKVKPQQQTAVMSTGPSPIGHPGPLSPPPYNSSNAQATAGHINYQPTIGGTAQFGGMSAIPSPPSVIFNSSQQIPAQGGLYGAFPIDGQVLGGGARSQFPQFPSPYGLSQSIGGTSAFSPQSMYLHQPAPHPQPPPPTAAPDMYSSSLSQFRLQAAAGIGAPYAGSGHHVGGTTPPQAPAAMLISTPPANSLAAVKPPPSQNQGTGGAQGAGGGAQQPPPSQGAPPGAVGSKGATGHYGGTGTLSSAIPSAPQPSPVYIQYNDQGQAVLNHSFLSAGSQMVQRPGPVQSTVVPPPIQPPTSFYSTSAGRHFTLFAGGQTGFYQPGSSGLGQAQLHQTAAAAAAAVSSAFGLAQGFGPSQSAPTPVGLQNFGSQLAAAQQYRSTYLKSGGGGGGSSGMPSDHLQTGGRSQLKSPSANPGSQPQAPPPDVLTSPFSSAQIPSPKSRNTKLQGGPGAGNQQQQQSPTQASTHQKFSSYAPVTALVLQQQQQNSNVRNQMGSGMTGLMRSGASGNSMNSAPSRYPSPIQRPVAVAPGGNSNRHRMPQQRTSNIGKHYFGHDSKSEEGNEAGKMDGGKAANGRGGEVPASASTPSPPNAASGQPSSPTTQASASADSAENVSGLEEQVPTTGAE